MPGEPRGLDVQAPHQLLRPPARRADDHLERNPTYVDLVRDALVAGSSVSLVRFVLWGEPKIAAYTQAASDLRLLSEGRLPSAPWPHAIAATHTRLRT